MCTVSWFHEPGGYQLLCNRDEKFSRKRPSNRCQWTREASIHVLRLMPSPVARGSRSTNSASPCAC